MKTPFPNSFNWSNMENRILDAEAYREAFERAKIAKRAVRKAIEENRRLGLPNVFYRNGRMYWELPDGTITYERPEEPLITNHS